MAYLLHITSIGGGITIEANDIALDALVDTVKVAREAGSAAMTSSVDDPRGISALLIKRKEA